MGKAADHDEPGKPIVSHRTAAAAAIIVGAILTGEIVWRFRPGPPELPEATAVTAGTVTEFVSAAVPEGAVVRLEYTIALDGAGARPRRQTATVAHERIPAADRFPPGSTVTVNYVPDDPARSIVRDFPGRPALLHEPQFLTGAAILLLGLAYAVIHRGR
jgi:hypothetical protein